MKIIIDFLEMSLIFVISFIINFVTIVLLTYLKHIILRRLKYAQNKVEKRRRRATW